jgi:curved DNA-binding protein CbpA
MKRNYHKLARKHHPDKSGGNETIFKLLQVRITRKRRCFRPLFV